MTKKTIYYKFSDRYLDLLNEFFNYLTIYKLEVLETFPKESNIVIFDEKDRGFSSYSNKVLKNLLKSKAPHILEVRKTWQKGFPWKVSRPINFVAQ